MSALSSCINYIHLHIPVYFEYSCDLFRSQGEILAIIVALAHSLGRRPETLLQSPPPLSAFTWQSGLWVLFLLSYLPGTSECISVHLYTYSYTQNTLLSAFKVGYQDFLPTTLFCIIFRFPTSLHAHVAPAQEGIGSCSTGRHRFHVVTKAQGSLISTSITLRIFRPMN